MSLRPTHPIAMTQRAPAPRWFRAGGLVCLALCAALVGAVAPAMAQGQRPKNILPFYLLELQPAAFMTQALAQPFGAQVVAEFAAVLEASGDAACRTSRGLTNVDWPAKARSILEQRGAAMLAAYIGAIDRAAYTRILQVRLGDDGVADFARLAETPTVRGYHAAEQPLRYANVLIMLVENITRFALIHRIELARSISPFENETLERADPTETIEKELAALQASDPFEHLAHYRARQTVAQVVLDEAVDLDKLKTYGPGDLLAGIAEDFASLCMRAPGG